MVLPGWLASRGRQVTHISNLASGVLYGRHGLLHPFAYSTANRLAKLMVRSSLTESLFTPHPLQPSIPKSQMQLTRKIMPTKRASCNQGTDSSVSLDALPEKSHICL